jgi:hypothetical protein
VVLVAAVIIWGCRSEIVRSGTSARRRIFFCALALPFLAHIISLSAAERALGYRTLLALSGLVLVLLVFAIRGLLASGKIKLVHHHGALVLIAVIAAVTAHFNCYNLIAVPQGYEWETIRGAVMRASFPKTSRIFIVTPTIEHRATSRTYADEFGSVTSDSDWESREMFLDALHERYPVKLPKGTDCKIILGREPPIAGQYDLVIDMRSYKEQANMQP